MDDSGDDPDSVVEAVGDTDVDGPASDVDGAVADTGGAADADESAPARRVSRVPSDAPDCCPVCAADYDSVSLHDAGLLVNLLDNEVYRRVCFEPVARDDVAMVRFYHHRHEQVE
jgi:hypothetical protein